MGILHQGGELTGRQVLERLSGDVTYSTVRKLLSILEEKGHVRHREANGAFVYAPKAAPEVAAESALRRIVQTFFKGSIVQTMAGLLSMNEANISPEEAGRLKELIEQLNQPQPTDSDE